MKSRGKFCGVCSSRHRETAEKYLLAGLPYVEIRELCWDCFSQTALRTHHKEHMEVTRKTVSQNLVSEEASLQTVKELPPDLLAYGLKKLLYSLDRVSELADVTGSLKAYSVQAQQLLVMSKLLEQLEKNRPVQEDELVIRFEDYMGEG